MRKWVGLGLLCVWGVLLILIYGQGFIFGASCPTPGPTPTPTGTPTPSIFTQPSLVATGPPGATNNNYPVPSNAVDVTQSPYNATCSTTAPSNTVMSANATAITSALGQPNLWVPAGCRIFLNSANGTIGLSHQNTGMYCAGDNIAGFYNTTGYHYSSSYSLFTTSGNEAPGMTIEGCVFSNTYTLSQYVSLVNQTLASGGVASELFIAAGNNIMGVFGTQGQATNVTIKNNLFTGNMSDNGIEFDGVSNSTFDNNVSVNNFLNDQLQVVNSHNIEIANNWIQQGQIAFVDFSPEPNNPGNSLPPSTANVFNNTITCTVPTPVGINGQFPTNLCSPAYQAYYTCQGFVTGCDKNQATGQFYGLCNYAGVNFHDNIWGGTGAAPFWNPPGGACGNGTQWCFAPGANNTYVQGASGNCTNGGF